MITNSMKLLIATMDMKKQSELRYKLESAGIVTIQWESKIFIVSEWFGTGNRDRYGSVGINQNYSYEYKIYVHKKDYEKALK